MRRNVMRLGMVFSAAAGVWIVAGLSASVQAAPIFSETFDGPTSGTATDKATLESDGWSFVDPEGNSLAFSVQENDAYMRIGGDTGATTPSVTKPFGSDVTDGSLHAVIGVSKSNATTTLALMDGSTVLFSLYVPPTPFVQVKGSTAVSYNGGNGVIASTVGSGSTVGYGNRVAATFTWHVNADGTDGTFSYRLYQPGTSTDGKSLDTGLISGAHFITDGVPDSIVFYTGQHDNASRLAVLYELSAQTVPEPAMMSLLGLGAVGMLTKRRR